MNAYFIVVVLQYRVNYPVSHFIYFLRPPRGLEDVSRYPYLFATLLEDPNWDEARLKKLAGLNFLRVFAKAEEVLTRYTRYVYFLVEC